MLVKVKEGVTNLVSVSATANPFLSADGMLDFTAVGKLKAQLDKAAGEEKPTAVYVISAKAKPSKFVASKNTVAKGKVRDYKYFQTRMVKVAGRKTAPRTATNVVLFSSFDAKVIGKELAAKQRQAVSAVGAHMRKVESLAKTISAEKTKNREAAQAEHDVALDALGKLLEEAGFDLDRDMVQSSGPFGSVTLLKVAKDKVVSIGKSDIKKFNAAKRAAANTSESSVSESAVSTDDLVDLIKAKNFDDLGYAIGISVTDAGTWSTSSYDPLSFYIKSGPCVAVYIYDRKTDSGRIVMLTTKDFAALNGKPSIACRIVQKGDLSVKNRSYVVKGSVTKTLNTAFINPIK